MCIQADLHTLRHGDGLRLKGEKKKKETGVWYVSIGELLWYLVCFVSRRTFFLLLLFTLIILIVFLLTPKKEKKNVYENCIGKTIHIDWCDKLITEKICKCLCSCDLNMPFLCSEDRGLFKILGVFSMLFLVSTFIESDVFFF